MIDLCVVNYNTKSLLERFLNTLHADFTTSGKVWNLNICDNGSTDGSFEWLEENKDTYYIANGWKKANIGYSAACNLMASSTYGDVIGLLNADVWLTSQDLIDIEKIILKLIKFK